MSGTAGNNVLREYLVSLKYQVDAAGKRNFINSLVDLVKPLAGATGAIVGLAAAITLMARRMAEASEQLYFMSQRTRTSALNIESATDAMTRFGVGTDAARGALESFSQWQRSMGPAATMFLRSLGVTATDATEQMAQLGTVLARMGGRVGQEGTLGYALAKQYAEMAGLNETVMRAITDPAMIAQVRRSRELMAQASGLDESGTQRMTANAHAVMNAFRDFTTMFEGFRNAFAAKLFPGFLDALQRIFKVLRENAEPIRKFFSGVAQTIVFLARSTATLIEQFAKLPVVMKVAVGAIALLRTGLLALGLSLLKSPLGWFIVGMTALLGLIEDYQVWKKGQETGEPVLTMFDWSDFDKMKTSIDEWVKLLTGIDSAFATILISLTAIVALAPGLWLVARAVRGVAAAAGLGAAATGGMLGWLVRMFPALAALGFVGGAGGEDPEFSRQKNEEWKRQHPRTPGSQNPIIDWWRRLMGSPGPGETETPGGVTPGSQQGAGSQSQQGFYDETYNNIYRAAVAKGLPNPEVIARVGAAQASQETGYGKHMVGNNLFGIKGPGVTAMTDEVINGQRVRVAQSFAGYASRADSAAGFVDFLARNPRYAAMLAAGNVEQAIAELGRSGYATDPNYARSVAAIHQRLSGRPLVPSGATTGRGVPGLSPNDVILNQTTSIQVAQGPTAVDTAAAVAREQSRVNEMMVRNTSAALA